MLVAHGIQNAHGVVDVTVPDQRARLYFHVTAPVSLPVPLFGIAAGLCRSAQGSVPVAEHIDGKLQ